MAFKRVTEEERRLVSYWRSKPFTPSSQQLTQAIEEPAPARLHPVCRNLTIDCTPCQRRFGGSKVYSKVHNVSAMSGACRTQSTSLQVQRYGK